MNNTEVQPSSKVCSMSNDEICQAIARMEFAQFTTADMILIYEWLTNLRGTVVNELGNRADDALSTYSTLRAMLVSIKHWEGGE